MTRHRREMHQPVLLAEVDDHVGHLAVLFHTNIEAREAVAIEVNNFVSRVAEVEYDRTGRETRTELGDDLLRQQVLPAR